MTWPARCPPELYTELQAILSYRSRPTPQDVWGVLVAIMLEKGVDAPEFDQWPEERPDMDQ